MTGSGTLADPYVIYDVDDLQDINLDLTAYYELANDIDASATVGWNGGAGFVPISDFTGQFDAKSYTISDLTINRSGSNRQALFAIISGNAVIQNVKMTGVSITSDGIYVAALVAYINGSSCTITNCNSAGAVESTHWALGEVGGLIGYMEGGTVSDCYSTCTVTGYDTCGGLIGDMRDGDIDNCYATGAVTVTDDYGGGLIGYMADGDVDQCYATGAVTVGDDYGGGFVGYAAAGTINNCYARGAVTGTDNYHGGFVGYLANATIEDCYSTGAPTGGGSRIGGFCGYNAETITTCFWDTETSETETSPGGGSAGATGKTTAQMKTISTFIGWDFSTIWGIYGHCNGGYPCLRDVTPSCEVKLKGNPHIDQRIYQHVERMER